MNTRDQYNLSTAINHTLFRQFIVSPYYMHWYRNQPRKEPTTDMKIGLATHSMALTPDDFNKEYIIVPEDAPKRPDKRQRDAKKPSQETLDAISFWDNFNANLAGKTALTNTEYNTARNCYFSIVGSKMWKELVSGKKTINEEPFYTVWDDAEIPFEIKGIPDLYIPETETVIDIKTINETPTPSVMSKAMYSRGYDTQGEFYRFGLTKCGKPVKRVVFAFVEKDHPFEVGFCEQSEQSREVTARFLREKMSQLSYCLSSNEYPKLDSFIATV